MALLADPERSEGRGFTAYSFSIACRTTLSRPMNTPFFDDSTIRPFMRSARLSISSRIGEGVPREVLVLDGQGKEVPELSDVLPYDPF